MHGDKQTAGGSLQCQCFLSVRLALVWLGLLRRSCRRFSFRSCWMRLFCVRSRNGGIRGTKWFCCPLVASPSNPTIRYGTSSTELFSLFESGTKDAEDAGSGSGSVRLILLWRLCPSDDVAAMVSSADTVVVKSGTTDVLTDAGT